MTNSIPTLDPADIGSVTGAFAFIFKKLMQSVDGCLPAEVIAFNRAKGVATVTPQIANVDREGNVNTRAPIAVVPVFQFGGGGFMLSFNLNPGDKGWVIANDRDISQYLQTLQSSPPNTFRMHNFADGWFLPAVIADFTIASEDSANAVFQSRDGTVKVSLGTNQIKIAAATIILEGNVIINGEVQANDAVIIDDTLTVTQKLDAQGGMTCEGSGGNVSIVTGNFRVVGNITASGSITPDVP